MRGLIMLRLRTVRFIGILLAFVMAASIFIGSPKTAKAATTIYVPDNYPTIQAAVDAASAGDTIIVRDGTYTENITLDKSITIKGEGMPVLDGSGVSSVITIIADGCTIDGFKITGGPPTWWLEAGIKVLSDNNTILNNVAENNGSYGIALFESNYNLLSNNVVENNAGGILLANSSHSILRHNIMNNQHYDFGVQHYDFGVPGEYLCYYLHDIDASNTVAGRPIYYLVDVEDRVLDSSTNAGYIGIVNSTNIVVKDLTLAHNRQGILFAWVQNSRIENMLAPKNLRTR
jgi:parallel beta-helix repeat protein